MNALIITYHAAYNYGSAMQAFALQSAIEALGHQCQIINYRFNGQKKFYSMIRTSYGIKVFISDLIQFPAFGLKKKRDSSFERFFVKYFKLTEEIQEPSEFSNANIDADIYISGSDQIWSKYSSELYFEDWKYMEPYMLTFTSKKKVAYASSIGCMQDVDLDKVKQHILKFAHIAMRESSVANHLSAYLNRPVETVLDPTLLHNADFYKNKFNLRDEISDYILFYTLRGPKIAAKLRKHLISIAQASGLKIYAITPYCFFPNNKAYINRTDAGPIEFLNLIKNAKLVFTDSFHGTAFSIIFQKNFYSVCMGWDTDYRKIDLLNDLGIRNRVFPASDCNLESNINYADVNKHLAELRKKSYSYLENAILN